MHHSTQAFLQAPAHYRACFPGDSVTAWRSLRHPRDSERPDVLAPGPSRPLRPARPDSPGTSRYQTWPRHCLTRPAGPRSAPPAMLIGAHGLSSRLDSDAAAPAITPGLAPCHPPAATATSPGCLHVHTAHCTCWIGCLGPAVETIYSADAVTCSAKRAPLARQTWPPPLLPSPRPVPCTGTAAWAHGSTPQLARPVGSANPKPLRLPARPTQPPAWRNVPRCSGDLAKDSANISTRSAGSETQPYARPTCQPA